MNDNDTLCHTAGNPRPRRSRKVFRILAWTLGIIVSLVIALAIVVTFWLSPERLSSLIAAQASRYLLAEVRIDNPRFTVWSSFPWLGLQSDSIIVTSRSLDDLDSARLRQLPPDAGVLARAASFTGNINLMECLSGRINLKDVELAGLDLKLVALNDSIANYYILPPSSQKLTEIPYFSVNSLKLGKKGRISYFSAADSASAQVCLDNAALTRLQSSRNIYRLSIPGKISFRYRHLQLLKDFPIGIDGQVALKFHPFSSSFTDCQVMLGSIKGRFNLDLLVGDTPAIRNFNYSIHEFSPSRLLESIPGLSGLAGMSAADADRISRITSDIRMRLSASLTRPYKLSATKLPFFRIDCDMLPASLRLDMSDGRRLPVNLGPLSARFSFNGGDPDASRLDISPLSVSTPGLDALVGTDIRNIMTAPEIGVSIHADANLASLVRSLHAITGLSGLDISGNASLDTEMAFRIADMDLSRILSSARAVAFSGKANISDFRCVLPDRSGRLQSRNLLLDFNNSSDHLFVKVRRGDISFSDPGDSLGLKMNSMKMQAAMPIASDPLPAGVDIVFSSGPYSIRTPDFVYAGKSLALKFSSSRPRSGRATIPMIPYRSVEDSLTCADQAHSPVMLTASLPPSLRRLMERLDIRLDISTSDGLLSTPAFPVANRIERLEATLGFDSVSIRNLKMRSQQTGLSLRGSIGNIRRFLTGPQPGLLTADLDLTLDTVQINQLARAYESGVALTRGPVSLMPPQKQSVSSDTIAFLIPRNLQADIRLHADQTVYTNLHLYDLGGVIRIADGNARITGLKVWSDFCHAHADVGFNTSDMQNMGIDLDLSLEDIKLTEFFENFHTLLLMMPQMKNLKGNLGVGVQGHIGIFPDMYLNMPGLNADIFLTGRGLTVHQSHFIRRITRMMLIHNSGDLHIEDMDVHATVHDNLLELYPFDFTFDDYSLRMEGLNNFNGNLCYHVGVMRSPLHIPFGINIGGMFHSPELRFGGVHYNIRNARKIASDIMPTLRINLIRELRYYLKEFVEKAADSDSSDNSGYLYSVPDYRKLRREARAASLPQDRQ